MPTHADDLIRRFEERNADTLVSEAEQRLRSRVICFTRTEVLRGFLQLSWLRTVAILQIPKDIASCIEPDFSVDEGTGKLRPAVSFTRDVELPCDARQIASLLGRFFKAITIEWNGELKHAEEDEKSFQAVAEWCAKHPEHPKIRDRRLAKWAS